MRRQVARSSGFPVRTAPKARAAKAICWNQAPPRSTTIRCRRGNRQSCETSAENVGTKRQRPQLIRGDGHRRGVELGRDLVDVSLAVQAAEDLVCQAGDFELASAGGGEHVLLAPPAVVEGVEGAGGGELGVFDHDVTREAGRTGTEKAARES